MKSLPVILAFLILETFSVAHAQQNQTESLIISTYYPSPVGVYRTFRFLPNDSFSSGDPCANEGETSYSKSDHVLYICKGISPKWEKVGSGSASSMRVEVFHGLSPTQCDGALVGPPFVKKYPDPTGDYQICTGTWYENITFSPAFKSKPHVMVVPEHISAHPSTAPSSRCCPDTDTIIAYPDNITEQGFQLHAAGSPDAANFADSDGCGRNNPAPSYDQNANYTRAIVGWIAIGEQ